VQRYVPNPLLIDGYKFDLRIYVLIGSIDPLRIYLFNDGLGRFATEAYETPHQSNFRSNYQHLTNYAINKLNPKFKAAMSGGEGEGGFKRSLQSVMKSLKEMGADTDLLWSRIKDISVKTIITSYEYIKHSYLFSQPEEYHNRMAFHILGLDILINSNL
jgi:Tubulin-tyrosine ligase family